MKVDVEKLKQRFSEIRESLEEIQKLTAIPPEVFWSEKRNMAAVKYFLLQAIEAVGSICTHICARKFHRGVTTLSDCFDVLREEGFLPSDMAERLKKMARFRNKLVHRYWEMDDRKILEHIQGGLSDFEDFMKVVVQALEAELTGS